MESLQNHFLIAMPALRDPNFEKTVTLICQHDEKGALGVVVNRATNMVLGDIFEELELGNTGTDSHHDSLADINARSVHYGGPVQSDRGLILHSSEMRFETTLQITESLCLTTSPDILEAMAINNGPAKSLVLLGHASWAPQQLEAELSENAWLSTPASEDIVFSANLEDRWLTAAAHLGVDIRLMSMQTGHA